MKIIPATLVSSAVALIPCAAHAITINFDAIDASGGAVSGAGLASYLAGYNVTASPITPGLVLSVQDEQVIYGSGIVAAPSPKNVFVGFGPASAVSYVLDLGAAYGTVSFTRAAFNNATHPKWKVSAFDAMNQLVDSAEESFLSGAFPASTFVLHQGAGLITQLRVEADAQQFAGFNTPLLDNLTLSADGRPLPEPQLPVLLGTVLSAGMLVGMRPTRRQG